MAKAPVAERTKREDSGDRPLIDSQAEANLKKLIVQGKERGYITYDELNEALPQEQVSSEQIEDFMTLLSEMGVNLIEADDAREQAVNGEAKAKANGAAAADENDDDEGEAEAEDDSGVEATDLATAKTTAMAAKPTGKDAPLDRTDDPVRMYLREMGGVELLSREGEVAIAKRIEAGRKSMIAGICESPLTIRAVIDWHDMLLAGTVLLRDIIDLDATYGAGPDGNRNQGMANHANNPNGANNGAANEATNGAGAPANDDSVKTESAEDGENGESAKNSQNSDADDVEDDEVTLSLTAKEETLKPDVLAKFEKISKVYKRFSKVQDIGRIALSALPSRSRRTDIWRMHHMEPAGNVSAAIALPVKIVFPLECRRTAILSPRPAGAVGTAIVDIVRQRQLVLP